LNEKKDGLVKRYPKRILASFQLGNLVGLMMSQMYSQQMPYYYRSFIGLDNILYLIASIIFMVFNMFNDPLLGYFCDKSKRFTKRWGKRFPFIVMGSIPYSFMVIILFSSPSLAQAGPLGVFLWFLIFQCIMDLLFSLFDINRVALFPDKFRHEEDRRKGGEITAYLETIGILLGVLIPVLIIGEFGEEFGYTLQAFIVATLSFIFFILMIPGIREDSDMRERRARLDLQVEPFFKGLSTTLKDKNFKGYMALYIFYTTGMGIIMASIPFFVKDILHLPKFGELLMIIYIIAVICAAPLWYRLSYRIGIKKVAMIGAFSLGLMVLFLFFTPIGETGLPIVIIVLIAAGTADGAIISMTMPIFSSVIDAAALRSSRRNEGTYQGTYILVSRIGIAINPLVFLLANIFTGYESGSTDPLELLGLRIQIAVFPMILIITGCFIFWKLYTITTDNIKTNTLKLKELDL
jgi:GPH family glycoside/pentoside/hexuronide:cation symporter